MHTDHTASIAGTFYVGVLTVTFDAISRVFGAPATFRSGKTDAEWRVRLATGEVCAIYNYKDGRNYRDEHGKLAEQITEWHVGAKSVSALALLQRALGCEAYSPFTTAN